MTARNSGTGSSCICSSSSERPARGRKNDRSHSGHASAPQIPAPSRHRLGDALGERQLGQATGQRPGGVVTYALIGRDVEDAGQAAFPHVHDRRGQVVVAGDGNAADRPADLVRIGVEDGGDVDSVLGEDRRARDRLAEAAGADERDVVLALRPKDLPDLTEQRVDVVTDTALAELPEGREVAADLRGVDVGVLRDLL